MRLSTNKSLFLCTIICVSLLTSFSSAFESDELLVDDEEFGLEGGRSQSPPSPLPQQQSQPQPQPQPQPLPQPQPQPARGFRRKSPESDSDSKIQFSLDHAFGDSDFTHAGNFSARLKTWPHGGQTLTKLRFSREDLNGIEKEKFKVLLQDDDFYKIRLPSNVINAPGKDYVVSSVKARCLPRDGLDEHFLIHMERGNILAVNYGSPGVCQYPRQLKQPRKWTFNSHTVLKNSEEAPRTPTFSEDIPSAAMEEEGVQPLAERSIWAKYWMYMIPLGLLVMNVVTQAMNLPEEQAGGPAASQGQQQPIAGNPRGQGPAVRRR